MNDGEIKFYSETKSTIRVAGSTIPKSAGRCAFHYLQKQMFPIDFMCIGGNANQQATKAMGIFCHMVANAPEFKGLQVAFQPLMFKTMPQDADGSREKTATVWRTVIFEPKQDVALEPEKHFHD